MDNVTVWGSLLLMAAGLGFVLFLIKVTVPRIFNNVLDHYGRRLELAEQIMNTRRAPREWVVKPMAQLETEDDPARRARIQVARRAYASVGCRPSSSSCGKPMRSTRRKPSARYWPNCTAF